MPTPAARPRDGVALAASLDDAPLRPFHLRVTATTFGANFSDGYALGMIGAVLATLTDARHLSGVWQGLLGASALIGLFFGSIVLGRVGDIIGRQKLYIYNFVLITVASALQLWAKDPAVLFTLRLLIGFGLGADYAVGPTMLSEFAPKRLRGLLLGSLTVMWTVGYVLAGILGTWLGKTEDMAYVLLATGALPALLVLLVRIGTPESPSWLVSQGRVEEARDIARRYLRSELGEMAEGASGGAGAGGTGASGAGASGAATSAGAGAASATGATGAAGTGAATATGGAAVAEPAVAGSTTPGPATAGTATSGTATAGATAGTTVGPATAGATSGPTTSGPTTAGPTAEPTTSGPTTVGPTAGPATSGPATAEATAGPTATVDPAATAHVGPAPSTTSWAAYRELFAPGQARRTWFGLIFYSAQVLPYFAIYTFMPTILLALNVDDADLQNLLLNLFLLAGGVTGLWFLQRMGRRPLVIATFGIMTAALALMGALTHASTTALMIPFLVYTFVMAGASNLTQVYPAELYPTHLRATGVGFLNGTSRIASAVGTFVLPVSLESIGLSWSMYWLAGVLLLGTVASVAWAPETKEEVTTSGG
ncbi:MFS transporter [Streptomyces sp. NPDC048442]|uniref:MFS transporter n=1 Tax=Streptomyces sp. NPDC048442 TaxID=3154823 RepID=UPI00343EF177